MAEARATYRALLRAIDRNITRVSGNSLWAQYAKEESCRPVTDKGDLACRLQKARDYIFLLESIRRHKVEDLIAQRRNFFDHPYASPMHWHSCRSSCYRTTSVFALKIVKSE